MSKQLILGIETSCDETSCGIVDTDFGVHANVIFRQETFHTKYGGVVPEVASRAHLEKISWVYDEALKTANITHTDISGIVFTHGPGLVGPLLVGATFGQGLAFSLGLPYEGVNHLEGHMAAAFLEDPTLKPPFLCLVVSGGHTELIAVRDYFKYEVLGRTRDDAVGEAFDKSGKLIGLGYPSGPKVSKMAELGNPNFVELPTGMAQKASLEFSFSGVKTAFLRIVQEHDAEWVKENTVHLCASLQYNLVETLIRKCKAALAQSKLPHMIVCGGVSANLRLRQRLTEMCHENGYGITIPRFDYCTDNGAMIAGAGVLRYVHGGLACTSRVQPSLRFEQSSR